MPTDDEPVLGGALEVPRLLGLYALNLLALLPMVFVAQEVVDPHYVVPLERILQECLPSLVLASLATVLFGRERDRPRPLLLFGAVSSWTAWVAAVGVSEMCAGAPLLDGHVLVCFGFVLAVIALFVRRREELVARLRDSVNRPEPIEVRDPGLVLVELGRHLPGATVASDALEGSYRGRALRIALVRERGVGPGYEITLATTLGGPRFGRLGPQDPPPPPPDGEPDPGGHAARWRSLFRIYSVSEVELGDGVIRANAGSGGGALPPPDEAERLLRLVARLALVSQGRAELDLVARESKAERCPYCHDGLAGHAGSPHVCTGCGTPHHAECWAELGGCAVMGCSEVRKRSSERVRD